MSTSRAKSSDPEGATATQTCWEYRTACHIGCAQTKTQIRPEGKRQERLGTDTFPVVG